MMRRLSVKEAEDYERLESHAKNIPPEVRYAIEALSDDARWSVFHVILTEAKPISFSQLMNKLRVNMTQYITYALEDLVVGGLIYENRVGTNWETKVYTVTPMGELVFRALMDAYLPKTKEEE